MFGLIPGHKVLMKLFRIATLLIISFYLQGQLSASWAKNLVSAEPIIETSPSAILATATGVVTLRTKRKNFPEDLIDLFTGSASKLPKQKKITVSGSYSGGSVLDLVEVSDTEPEYSFQVAVLSSVMSSSTTKLVSEVQSLQSVEMTYTNANNIPDVIESANHRFTSKKITNKRLNDMGTLSGSFSESGAQGRFLIKLDFTTAE